ncbi:MAG: 23S rRNA (adenine(2030)-N(6))-methyltransferase RlmJ [Pseudomonadota bacterium]
MNYRHAYHAGNFADVVKHIILTRVIAYLQRKEAGFLMLDSHAGIGRYDLSSQEAGKTGEATRGIKRFFETVGTIEADAKALLDPYVSVVRALNSGNAVGWAPGSPEIMVRLRRQQDRCVFNELHPDDHDRLVAHYGRDRRTEVIGMDGWTALRAKLPPPEKRGLVLIDPPFEKTSEADDLLAGLGAALKRFSTGTFLIWYPIKDARVCDRLRAGVKALDVAGALDTHLFVQAPQAGQFAGSGMIIVNPPFVLHEELQILLPLLAQVLSVEPGSGKWATHWLIEPR